MQFPSTRSRHAHAVSNARSVSARRLLAAPAKRMCSVKASETDQRAERRAQRQRDDGRNSNTATTDHAPPTAAAPSANSPFQSKQGGTNQWRVNQWPVAEVLGVNFLFFEAQESGRLRGGHRIEWRGDSYVNDKWNNRSLAGGWFDAGDHLKLVYPMCWSVAHMAWSMAEGKQLLKTTLFGGQSNWDAAVRSLNHGLRFLFQCHIQPGQFISQVGESDADHADCHKAEQDRYTPRTSYATNTGGKRGSDLLFQASAAFAAAAVALRGEPDDGSKRNQSRAAGLAKSLYDSARTQSPSIYSESEPECAKTYRSDNWEHTAFWAAAWMFRLTGKHQYSQDAKQFQFGADRKAAYMVHNWANVYFGACLIMWEETGCSQNASDDRHGYENNLARLADAHLNVTGGVSRTPKNLTYVDNWGSLRHACGVAWVLAGYARGLRWQARSTHLSNDLMWLSERQVTYAMGASGRSFIVGFGNNPPKQPHHRNASLRPHESNQWTIFNNINRANPNTIRGALVGGPDVNDNYNDRRNNYQQNEVALDYNAAFLAALVQTAVSYND